MALPIRDGNQSLTTLSTIIVNSAHVPAHSVVSLGSQAITDIAQAVSGVELGPNTISALENISVTFGVGTSITIGNVVSVTGGLTNAELRASSVTIGGSVQVSNFPATQSVTFSTPTITGSVSVLNLPATQTVTFTEASVTFGQAVVSASNIGDLLSSVATDNTPDATTKFVKIGGHQSGSNQTSHIVHVSAGGSMSVDASGSSVTFTEASVTFSSITGSVSVLNFPATQIVSGSVTASNVPQQSDDTDASAKFIPTGWALKAAGQLDQWKIASQEEPLPVQIAGGAYSSTITISGSVTFTQASVTFGTPVVTGSVSVLNFPSTQTIAGTVTANVDAGSLISALDNFGQSYTTQIPVGIDQTGFGDVPISGTVTANTGDVSSLIGGGYANLVDLFGNENIGIKEPSFTTQIAGTVTANVAGNFNGTIENYDTDGTATHKVAVQIYDPNGQALGGGAPLPISGTVTANVANSVTIGSIVGPIGGSVFKGISGSVDSIRALPYFSQTGAANYNELSTSNPFPVAGTVTANNPSGALTTRFGSVTTANTAEITSAVTNTSRKYLLAQNISAGTVTIGIGFSPTTTQGIQLSAGGGLTFDAFCPTGAVYWLGAVTGAAFTILEG